MSAAAPAIVVSDVSKSFRIPREQVSTLKERVLHPLRSTEEIELKALQEVSFTVEEGEFFGIVGRNGSGKSTMLKCLAGIYATDRGRMHARGRVSTFIELGVGFNPDLAARDNVALNATMLGLSGREGRRRFDAIIDFAELREFADLKIKNYSSGMLVRLAFAVMVQVDADIFLIDEVLAVGDAAFQQKCFDEFERIHQAGKTIILVTHDMGSVVRFCQRAMLLEKGKTVAIGDPEAVGSKYLEINFDESARAAETAMSTTARVLPKSEGATRFGDGTGEVVDAWFEDANGVRTDHLLTDHHATFACHVRFDEAVTDPRVTMTMQNARHDILWRASTEWKDAHTGSFAPGEQAHFRMVFPNYLSPDRYLVTVAVEHPGGSWIDRRERMLSVVVSGLVTTGALVQIPYEVDVHRLAPVAT